MEWRMVQAELLFQNARPADADLMMRGVVRKNPNYAGARPLSQGYSVTLYNMCLVVYLEWTAMSILGVQITRE